MSDELKPCNQCEDGGEPRIVECGFFYVVGCNECGYTTGAYYTKESAIAAWNRRADDAPEQPVDNGADVVAILRKYATFWSVSHATNTQCDSDWEITTMRALADMIERDYVRRDSIADDAPISEKPVASLKESAEDTQVLTDSREKLEADIDREFKESYKGTHAERHYTRELIVGWLDRQAAITERELCGRCSPYATAKDYMDTIDSLTAERDHFRKHVNYLMALIADIARKQPHTFDPEAPYETLDTIGDYLDELQDKVDSLTAEVEAQCKRANDAERGVLSKAWYVSRDRYEDDVSELKAERDKLLAELEAYRDFENGEFAIPLGEAMKFTTDPPGYVKKHIAELQAERDEWKSKAKEEKANADGHWHNANKLAKEHDKLCKRLRGVGDLNDVQSKKIAELTVERDQLQEQHERQVKTIERLAAERDELKAFAKRLETASRDKLGVTLFGVDYVTEEFMLHVRDTLTAERDKLQERLEADVESLKRANRIQADSFQKLERELAEARAK